MPPRQTIVEVQYFDIGTESDSDSDVDEPEDDVGDLLWRSPELRRQHPVPAGADEAAGLPADEPVKHCGTGLGGHETDGTPVGRADDGGARPPRGRWRKRRSSAASPPCSPGTATAAAAATATEAAPAAPMAGGGDDGSGSTRLVAAEGATPNPLLCSGTAAAAAATAAVVAEAAAPTAAMWPRRAPAAGPRRTLSAAEAEAETPTAAMKPRHAPAAGPRRASLVPPQLCLAPRAEAVAAAGGGGGGGSAAAAAAADAAEAEAAAPTAAIAGTAAAAAEAAAAEAEACSGAAAAAATATAAQAEAAVPAAAGGGGGGDNGGSGGLGLASCAAAAAATGGSGGGGGGDSGGTRLATAVDTAGTATPTAAMWPRHAFAAGPRRTLLVPPQLRSACGPSGVASGEPQHICITVPSTSTERRRVAEAFERAHGIPLEPTISSGTPGCFNAFLTTVMESIEPSDLDHIDFASDADILSMMMKDSNSDHGAYVRVLPGEMLEQISLLKAKFEEKYDVIFWERLCNTTFVRSDSSVGEFRSQKSLLCLVSSSDMHLAYAVRGCIEEWGTNASGIIICFRSLSHAAGEGILEAASATSPVLYYASAPPRCVDPSADAAVKFIDPKFLEGDVIVEPESMCLLGHGDRDSLQDTVGKLDAADQLVQAVPAPLTRSVPSAGAADVLTDLVVQEIGGSAAADQVGCDDAFESLQITVLEQGAAGADHRAGNGAGLPLSSPSEGEQPCATMAENPNADQATVISAPWADQGWRTLIFVEPVNLEFDAADWALIADFRMVEDPWEWLVTCRVDDARRERVELIGRELRDRRLRHLFAPR